MKTQSSPIFFLLTIAACAVGVSCRTAPGPKPSVVLTTQKLSIVDSAGRERIAMGGESENGRPVMTFRYPDGDIAIQCGLAESIPEDPTSSEKLDDAAFLYMGDSNGDAIISATVSNDGAVLSMEWFSKVSFTVTTTKDSSVLEIAPLPADPESDEPPRYFIRITCDANGLPQLELSDAEGRKVITAH